MSDGQTRMVWYLLHNHRVASPEWTTDSREKVLAEVERRNTETPGHTCIGVPSHIEQCEGCYSPYGDYCAAGLADRVVVAWYVCGRHGQAYEPPSIY
jgi:hypothetical protein